VNKKGDYGSAALWNGAWRIDRLRRSQYAVMDSRGARLLDSDFLFEREPERR
jgi:hypothetical protein